MINEDCDNVNMYLCESTYVATFITLLELKKYLIDINLQESVRMVSILDAQI